MVKDTTPMTCACRNIEGMLRQRPIEVIEGVSRNCTDSTSVHIPFRFPPRPTIHGLALAGVRRDGGAAWRT